MTRPTVTQGMIKLYDEYTHLTLDRRGFMAKLTRLAGSSAAAAAIVPLLAANQARAAIVPADDDRLMTETVTFDGAGGDAMGGYIARPADASGPLPSVIVIHENRGLNPHIEDVARRVAIEGFLALAPDFLMPAGGTPEDEDRARDMIGELDRERTIANAVAAAEWLRANPMSNGNVGVIGFCWGGAMANQLAVADPELKAAVAYYGSQPSADQVAAIEARLMLHYAELDERINAGIAEFEEALRANELDYQIFMYEGVNHAFNNDTSEARYDQEAADLAWSRTIGFLSEALG